MTNWYKKPCCHCVQGPDSAPNQEGFGLPLEVAEVARMTGETWGRQLN